MYSQVTVWLLLHYDSLKWDPFYCQPRTLQRCRLHPPWVMVQPCGRPLPTLRVPVSSTPVLYAAGVQTPLVRARTKGRQMSHPGRKTSGGAHSRGRTGSTLQTHNTQNEGLLTVHCLGALLMSL